MKADISVIISTYTEARWNELVAAVESVQRQQERPREIIIVVDHNPALLKRVRAHFSDTIALENQEALGVSGARNTGVAASQGAIVAFLDDDAAADPDWLEQLSVAYGDLQVVGVGGATRPRWLSQRPNWFPDEFNWVVGCDYQGLPEDTTCVRNFIGANMSFRREVFARVGGFRNGIGPTGKTLGGCEETEFCIRINQRWPQHKLLYEPRARVSHMVLVNKAQWHYFYARCYAEGRSKALVTQLVGTKDGLASERTYMFRTLPGGVTRSIIAAISDGDLSGLARAGAIIVGLTVTIVGYVAGLMIARMTRLRQIRGKRTYVWEEPAL